MKHMKIKRLLMTVILVLLCYVLQCAVFPKLALASINPNLLIIITASLGFMRGTKTGMFVGFFSGLLLDIQFGDILGLYALLYLLIGYVNGLFDQWYFNEDIKLPLILITISEAVYGLVVYILMFLLRSEFNFSHYFVHIIIPELIYTIVVTLIVYPLILYMNQKLDAEEKRSMNKLV